MIVIMPAQYRDLNFFLNAATNHLDTAFEVTDDKNILSEAIMALENQRNSTQRPPKLIIKIPEFKVDTNTNVEKHLRKVS